MDQQKPQNVTGHVNWEKDQDGSANLTVSNEPRVRGPMTGNDVSRQVNRARTSSRRTRKSESAFRTISEVADVLDVQQHVLRFWETKFSQIRPLKRGGGRRYYRPEDLELLKRIHHLLYVEGYTIKGVQKLLKEQGKKAVVEAANEAPKPEEFSVPESDISNAQVIAKNVQNGLSHTQRSLLESTLDELKSLRSFVGGK